MRRVAALLLALLLLGAIAHAQPKRPLSESEKIEALITLVENLKDARFIRNGAPHDCKEAAAHLRDKWKWKRDEIKTARDFILVAASFSSQSGKPYLIRFSSGTEVKSAEFLLAALKRMERGME